MNGRYGVATAFVFAVSLAGCGAIPETAAPSKNSPEGQFIRQWLVCGEFPNPPHEGSVHYNHTPPCVGLDTDYLVEHGGEANIQPVAGMKHKRPDKTEATWFAHTAETGIVDLSGLLKGRQTDDVVAYAFAIIEAQEDSSCLLTVGSDDGVRVWLNGKVVDNVIAGRYMVADTDTIPVSLRKGVNRLLIKVEQGAGDWGCIVRVSGPHEMLSDGKLDLERGKLRVSLRAAADVAGMEASVLEHGQVLGRTLMRPGADKRTVGEVDLSLPEYGHEYEPLQIVVNGQAWGRLQPPALAAARAEAFQWQTPRGYPCVFKGELLPPVDFENRLLVEKLIGRYTLSVQYYDIAYNEVQKAAQPGRYGAVVTIKTADRTTRRFVTLFRQPEDLEWWRHKLEGAVTLPKELGIPEATQKGQQQSINDFIKNRLADGFSGQTRGAILLAGLSEAAKDAAEPSYFNKPELRDRKWWLPLKRKLYGFDAKYTQPFICPKKIAGAPARVVREGTLQEAGMEPGFPKSMDEHLAKWAAESNEAFAVMVVRHGVIAYHKAFGTRDGKPMTLTTKSWMASTTKMLSGTLLMMLVDQGLINLDDRADKYLPPLRTARKEFPATVRHLYTHTAGLQGHWGSWFSDMEERVADTTPFYNVGKEYIYDGAGMDLGMKILEGISGETLPQFFQNHLLGPLGCKDTDVSNACSDAASVPMDMARIAQMLLQKGAYGDMRFFREETFGQMLPERLTKVLGPKATVEYGMGTTWFDGEGLGKGTFGHGAASLAYTRIDPANDLVIIMTRNSAGRDINRFTEHSKRFFEIITENIVGRPPKPKKAEETSEFKLDPGTAIVLKDDRNGMPAGTKLLATPCFAEYSLAPVVDGIKDRKDLRWDMNSWASSENASPHGIEIQLAKPMQGGNLQITWAFDIYNKAGGLWYTSRAYSIQVKAKAEDPWQTVADVKDNQSKVSLHALPKEPFRFVRIVQLAGGGSASRLNIMWIGQIEMTK